MGQTVSFADGFCGQVENLPQPKDLSPVQSKELPRLLGTKAESPETVLKVEKEPSPKVPLQDLELAVPDESVEIQVHQAPQVTSEEERTAITPRPLESDVQADSSDSKQDAEKLQRKTERELLKTQKKAERAEAKIQIEPFLRRHGFTSVKSKKTWLWRVYYPLHVAVEKNDLEALKTLIKAGADLTKKNNRGQTPLQLATRLNKRGDRAEMLQALATASAKASKVREKRKTAVKPKQAGAAASSWEPITEQVDPAGTV